MPTEVTHYNIQPTIELTMGVYGRDLGHVSDDVAKVLDKFGKLETIGTLGALRPRQQREARCWPAPRSCSPASTSG